MAADQLRPALLETRLPGEITLSQRPMHGLLTPRYRAYRLPSQRMWPREVSGYH
jgi:hypothetical protein